MNKTIAYICCLDGMLCPIGLNGRQLINSYLQQQFTEASYGITGSTGKRHIKGIGKTELLYTTKGIYAFSMLSRDIALPKAANSGRAL